MSWVNVADLWNRNYGSKLKSAVTGLCNIEFRE